MAAFGSEQTEESIQSNFGKFYRTDQLEDKKTEAYQYISDSHVITFRLLTKDENEKQLCKEIIASATSCYEAVAETYASVRGGLRSNPITYFANDSTYYPEQGFMFVNPYDMTADVKANDFEINASETRLDAFVTLDEFVGEDYAGYFWEKDFNMKYTFLKRTENADELKEKIDSYIKVDSYLETCRRNFFYPVAGLAANVYVFGNTYLPTIAVVIPAKDYEAVFVFEKVSSKELADIETILSLMRVDAVQKEGMKTLSAQSQSFREAVNIRPAGEREYPAIRLKNVSTKNTELIVCDIPSAKAKITLPALSTVVVYPTYENLTADKKKRYNITLNPDTEELTPKDEAHTGVVSYSESYDNQVVIWVPTNAENYSAEEYFQRQYTDYECKKEFEQIKRLGSANIKGRIWYVITASDEDIHMDAYITENNGKIIEVRVVRTSQDDDITNKAETLLQKSSFK